MHSRYAPLPQNGELSSQPKVSVAVAEPVGRFRSIALSELGGSALMDRLDCKFVVPVSMVSGLLHGCAERYRVLEVNGRRLCRYFTTYFDTHDLAFFRAHEAGRLPRRKIRIRDYVDTGALFLEEKVKNAKGRTIKSRVEIDRGPASANTLHRLLDERSPNAPLSVSLLVDFDRVTLVDTVRDERVTFDFGLQLAFDGEVSEFPHVVIVEVKRAQRSRSAVLDDLRTRNLRAASFSKYCLGVRALRGKAVGTGVPSALRLLRRTSEGQAHAT